MILLKRDTVENWAYYTDVFSSEQCDAIIKIGKEKKLHSATVVGNDEGIEGKVDSEYRKSNITWLDDMDLPFVYDRLIPLVNEVNSKYFNFDLYGFTEDLQFTEYTSPGGKYKYHVDKLYNSTIRKLSMVVQLSDENTYEGGDLQLLFGENPDETRKNRGCVLFFPSYVLHRVTPVTSGTRYSLVTWLGGPPFK